MLNNFFIMKTNFENMEERYVSPETEVLCLNEQKVIMSSNEGIEDDDDIN